MTEHDWLALGVTLFVMSIIGFVVVDLTLRSVHSF